MKRYIERKDASPDPYPALVAEAQARDRARRPTVCGPLIALLIIGSGVFVVVRRVLVDPGLPPWAGDTSSDGIGEFTALLAMLEWVLLGVLAVAPIALVATTVERIWVGHLVVDWPAPRVQQLSNVVGVIGLALAVPLWVIVWERVVLPFERGIIGAIVMGVAIWLITAAGISAYAKKARG